jgi:hypothetical protein
MCFVKIGAAPLFSFTEVNARLTQYLYFLTYLVKFGIDELHEMPLIQFDIRKNQCSEKPYYPAWWPRKTVAPIWSLHVIR